MKPPPPARSEPGPTREGAGPRDRSPTISFAPRSIETCSEDSEDTRTSRSCGQPSPGTPAARAVPPSGHPTPTALSTCSLLSAVSSHNDADNRCRRYDPTVTGLQNLRTPHAKSRQNGLRRLEFRRRGLPLDREQLAAGAQQAGRPADEPVERRHRPRRRHVRADPRRPPCPRPGPGARSRWADRARSRTLRERPSDAAAAQAAPPEDRAEASPARSPAARPRSRCRPARRASGTSSATSAQFSRWRSHSRDGLPGADEPARHPVGGEQLDVSLRLGQRVAEFGDRLGRGRGENRA